EDAGTTGTGIGTDHCETLNRAAQRDADDSKPAWRRHNKRDSQITEGHPLSAINKPAQFTYSLPQSPREDTRLRTTLLRAAWLYCCKPRALTRRSVPSIDVWNFPA